MEEVSQEIDTVDSNLYTRRISRYIKEEYTEENERKKKLSLS